MRTHLTVMAALATVLASIGLYPLFESAGWFPGGFGAVLAVAATGLLTRRFRVHGALAPVAGLAALYAYLTMVYAPGQAVLGLIPTPASTQRLADLVVEGGRVATTYAAPVPLLPGISFLTVAGIGVVAVLVDFVAVRLRRAAAAGLPLLAMYSVPAAVRQETVGWLAFLLGAGGFLALLVADSRERLASWGRPVFTRRWSGDGPVRGRPDSSPLSITGRRVGLTAVLIAIIVPVAVPGIEPTGVFGLGGRGGPGSSTITTPDPMVSLKRELVRSDDAVVLRYRSTDEAPDYLRMYSLDRFDGEGWTYSAMRGDRKARVEGRTLPDPPGVTTVPVRKVTTRIAIDRRVSRMNVLPAPYAPAKIDIKGDWRADHPSLMVFSLHDSAGGRSYTVQSLRPEPTYAHLGRADEVPSDIAGAYLAVPRNVPANVAELARTLTAKAATPYEKAVKLQEWFTAPGNFSYSLNTPPPRNVNALRDFLFGSKTGYCEQFAASMALLARIAGVPARVSIGYTAGTPQADGTWVVRTKDTHAWPELYLGGAGWLRFEPTPAGGDGQGNATVPAYATPTPDGVPPQDREPGASPTGQSSPSDGTGSPTRAMPRHREDVTGGGDPGDPIRPQGRDMPVGGILAALAAVLVLVLPATLRMRARRRRRTPSAEPARTAHAAWDELRADAIDHRLPWRASDSPRAAARRLIEYAHLGEAAEQALTRLARSEERARYARTPGTVDTAPEDLRVVHAAFVGGAAGWVRWQARLCPPSTMAAVRGAVRRMLELAGRPEAFLARLRRRVLRHRESRG